MKTNPDNTAFPATMGTMGLTKREYFAAQALSGICADRKSRFEPPHRLAIWAVQCADALIDALNAPTKEGEKPNDAELLAALERTLSWLSSYPGNGAKAAYEQARAAITKAKGE